MTPASVFILLSPFPTSWCGNHTHEQAFFSFSTFEGRWKVFLVLKNAEPWNPSETHPDRNSQVLFIIMSLLYKITGFTVVFHECIYNMCWSQSCLLLLQLPRAHFATPLNSPPSNFPDYFSPLHSTWRKGCTCLSPAYSTSYMIMVSSPINLPENEIKFPLYS